jgi:amino acid transporter
MTPIDGSIEAAEASVQSHSTVLRKELGLRDLVLAQILLIIVPDYIGTAVKAGSAHVALWLMGILLFFVPLALVVIHLSRLLPLEGGMYEWARIAFNDRVGFFVAWNLWLYVILYVGLGGLLTVSYASYVIPGAEWVASSKGLIMAASAVVTGMVMSIAGLGMKLGKWISNAGSIVFVLVLGLLIATPFLNVHHGSLAEYHPFHLVAPPLTLLSLSVFSKMTFGALTGFEYVAVFAGECRDPERDLPRSVWLSGPIIAIIYILVTGAVLAFVPPSGEDVVAPLAQGLSRGLRAFGVGHAFMPPALLFILIQYLATFCAFFAISTRLPMVAGWDHLLPEWFSRLHPKYKTPVNSVLVLGAATLVVAIMALSGVRPEESFELLLTWSFTFYGIAYLALCAIPIFSPRSRGLRPAAWVRFAAGSGLVVTLLSVVLSISPVIDVGSSWLYSIKIAGGVVGMNLLGVLSYRLGRQKETSA